MKRNLYLLSMGLVLCSCSERYDVVTGHARIVTKSTPVVEYATVPEPEPAPAPQPAPVSQPDPEPIQVAEPGVDYVIEPVNESEEKSPAPDSRALVSQNQPALVEPAPIPQEKPVQPEPTPAACTRCKTSHPHTSGRTATAGKHYSSPGSGSGTRCEARTGNCTAAAGKYYSSPGSACCT